MEGYADGFSQPPLPFLQLETSVRAQALGFEGDRSNSYVVDTISLNPDDFRYQLGKTATSMNEMFCLTSICEGNISVLMRDQLDSEPLGLCMTDESSYVLL